MAKELLLCLCFVLCVQFVLQFQMEQIIDQIRVDNCIFYCGTKWVNIFEFQIQINCIGQTSLADKNYTMNDILDNIDHLSYDSNMRNMTISSNYITGLNTNYFCSIKNYKFQRLNIEAQLNDVTKIGFGDINKCEDDNSTCSNAIKFLHLSGNPLKILKNNTFCHLKNLTELHLSDCSLNSIEIDAFKFNGKLEKLQLGNNRLTKIPYLGHLKSIKVLYLYQNLFTSIRNDDFINCKKLQILLLFSNRINYIDDKAFDQLSNLNLLDLSNNSLTTISKTFKKLNANILNLDTNLLEVLDMLDFSKKLEYIYARFNLLTNISANITNSELISIDFSFNRIKSVNDLELSSTIETIDFYKNEIEYFSIQSLKNGHKPKEIILNRNKIKIVSDDGIKPMIYYLNNNPIACSCENSWLFSLENEENIILNEPCSSINKYNPIEESKLNALMLCESNFNNSNRCRVKHLNDPQFQCQFKCLNPCYCYTTAHFSLAIYYCSKRQLQSVPQWTNSGQLHRTSQLQLVPQWINSDYLNSTIEMIVWLNGNNFSEITNENFTGYDNLMQLYLINSQITSIGPLTFAKMSTLLFLDLSYNKLTTIKDGTFNQLIYLQVLILSHNQIANLPDNCFNNTITLQRLHLHNNSLTNFAIENLSNRPILRELTLHNNNWTCNCSFIIEFQNFLNHHSYSVKNQNEIYCVNENGSLATSPVSEYNTSHCTEQNETTIDNTWPIVIGIIAPLCVFAIVYGVIRGIKSYLRANHAQQIECAYRLMKNAGTPIETDGKVFDVFISYSNEDSLFVATKILPKLEDIKDPYHVCVHERNFLGGGSIEDTIIEAIKKSTRIIVILTENYLQSNWCMYEFVIAHSVMIEDQCPRVVLVIKEHQPPDMNPNLQIYMSTNTYIEWTDQKFWQRLHFALSSNKLPMEQTLQPMNFLMSTRFIMPDD
ncbi:TOLL-like receptor [Chamberlinius hualienensis]